MAPPPPSSAAPVLPTRRPTLTHTRLDQMPGPVGLPFLRLGFRPFYLGAALFAALAIPLWIALFLGAVALPAAVPPLLWHAHEMLFGFAVAVIVGFLLTATRAWTGLETLRGPALGALALLWLAARITAVTGPYALHATLDSLLLPVVALVLLGVLWRARNVRNLPLAAILTLLAQINIVFHLAVAGRLDLNPLAALYAGLALIILIETVIAGRVVPFFSMNALPGLKITRHPRLEWATVAATLAGLGLWVATPAGNLSAAVLTLAAVLHAARLVSWRPWVTWRRPMLWILHAAYAWIPLGLALLAAAQLEWISASAGVHALGVGATAGLIIGMMTRTARGHTGRPLVASRLEVWAYALILGTAAVRVFVTLFAPHWLVPALLIAATAWTSAFLLYVVRFAPWLLRTRPDGKDG